MQRNMSLIQSSRYIMYYCPKSALSYHRSIHSETSRKMFTHTKLVPITLKSGYRHLCHSLVRHQLCPSTFSPQIASNGSTLIERRVSVKNRPDIWIVQAGHMDANGLPSARKTVLLLPGVAGTALIDFRHQLERLPALLPADHSVIAWDPPGRGRSRPPHWTFPVDFFQRHADAAVDLMEALGCESFSVVGWSAGGATGILMAAQRPDIVKKLVTCATSTRLEMAEMKYFNSEQTVSPVNLICNLVHFDKSIYIHNST